MKIKIELKGPLALNDKFGPKVQDLVIYRPLTVRQVARKLGIEERHIGMVAVNGVKVTLEAFLGDGDFMVIFPVVAGG